jgi:hypothetical protein
MASATVPPAPALALSNSRQGCLNQWLFNGVWRAKVTNVEPIMNGSQQSGWRVTEVWRNGTSRELAPADSFLLPEHLALSNAALEAEGHNQEGLAYNTQAPSGQFTYTQVFYGPNMQVDPKDKPKALDIAFEGDKLATMSNKPHFSSRQYNFHYDLSCVASGAAAQAQGGSNQLAASEGCMNQWMSNGVWKMRVLAVTPFPVGAAAKDQIGWHVRQEWVNITHGKVYAGGLPDIPNRVAPTNVSDEFLATKNGNNASTFNTAGGFALDGRHIPFPPGVPYTFEQLIGWAPFDAADAPTRLLVTFDTATQDKLKMAIPVPHYRKPANFRISLTCGGTVTMAPGWETLHTPEPSQPAAAQPATQTAAQSQQVATAQAPSNRSNSKVDPCAMLSQNDVASALGVGARSIGTAQHPSANECAWAVASHAGAPAQNVVLVMQQVQATKTCRGFGCLSVVQSVLGSHAIPGLPSQFADAFNDAQMIAGLGDKASWKDGRLTVVRADMAFQLLVRGSGSPALNVSEALARDVLYRVATP